MSRKMRAGATCPQWYSGCVDIFAASQVGKIAVEHPMATRVFGRHQIDYCCGGGHSLADACERGGIDVALVLRELREELQGTAPPATQWDRVPPSVLIAHIISTYHEPLREELPRLETMARTVQDVHGDKDERLALLVEEVAALRSELLDHMMKEERILFPRLQMGQPVAAPIQVMEREHDDAGRVLKKLRSLTDDYCAPAEACATWRALLAGLEQLEQDLHDHIHLENNILFQGPHRVDPQ